MSEYQYYEFQAIDRPLTSSEIDKLRSYSTRARITSTSFVNDYSWGSFKGDEDAWMERYFVGGDHAVIAALQQRLFKAHADEITKPETVRRTVAALLRAAEEQSEKRWRAEAELCAKATARRERGAALAREKHLKSLAGREGRLWADVKSLVASKRQLDFDQAVTILVDLRDLAAGAAGSDFQLRVGELRQMHARKRTFLERLQDGFRPNVGW